MDMIQNKKMHLLTIIINIFSSSFKVNNLNWYKLNILFRNRMNITYDMLNRVCIAYFIFYLLSIRNFWSCYFVQAVWASPFIINMLRFLCVLDSICVCAILLLCIGRARTMAFRLSTLNIRYAWHAHYWIIRCLCECICFCLQNVCMSFVFYFLFSSHQHSFNDMNCHSALVAKKKLMLVLIRT